VTYSVYAEAINSRPWVGPTRIPVLMCCTGQSHASSQLRRSATRPSTARAAGPQSSLPGRGLRTQTCSRAVANYAPVSVGDHRIEGDWAVRHALDCGDNRHATAEPVALGHGQHHHRRESALRRTRAPVPSEGGVGRRKDSERSRSIAVTAKDRSCGKSARGLSLVSRSLTAASSRVEMVSRFSHPTPVI